MTSYAELVLAPPSADLSHPAFARLFLETERMDDIPALLCHRRRRDSRRPGSLGLPRPERRGTRAGRRGMGNRSHAIHRPGPRHRPAPGARGRRAVRHDRNGARRDLQPAAARATRTRPSPHASRSRRGLRQPRTRLGPWRASTRRASAAARVFALAFTHAQSTRQHLDISPDDARLFERLASRVFHTDWSLRASPDVLAANELGQPGLWPHGISGDLPLVVVTVTGGDDDLALARQVLQAQEYWRLKGLQADVVILNAHAIGYLDEVQAPARGAARQRSVARLEAPARAASFSFAPIASAGARAHAARSRRAGRAQQRPRGSSRRTSTRPIGPSAPPRRRPDAAGGQTDRPTCRRSGASRRWPFRTGLEDSSTKAEAMPCCWIRTARPPLPWVNVLANPRFGTIVTSSGAAHTWADNSRENRLTPFWTDPVSRSHVRSALHPRRRDGTAVVADGRARPAPGRSEAASSRRIGTASSSFERLHAGIRHALAGLRRPVRPGQVLGRSR